MAHAWCEVFDENLGWMAREHTLSYQNSSGNRNGTEQIPEQTTRENNRREEKTSSGNKTETPSEMTSDVGHTRDSDFDTKEETRNTKINAGKWLFVILRVFLLLCMICGIGVVQCGIRINRKLYKFKRRKDNAGIRCIYHEIVEVCRFCGFKTESKTEEEILQQIKIEFFELSDEEWQWIYDCVNRATFSGKTAEMAERNKMYALMIKFKKKVWAGLSIQKRFVFKFVKAM